ncbi:MAG: glycosyltransferase [Thermoanaerobaculia bacterium]
MHLVYVTAALPLGLDEPFIAPEVLELQRRGHRVTVIPIRPRHPVFHADARRLAGATIAEPLLSLRVVGKALTEILRAPKRVVRAVSLLLTSRDIFVLAKNLAVIPKALWLAHVASRNRVDHIHAHWASTSATAALIASVVSGIPWSFTAHRWDITEDNLLDRKVETAGFARAIDSRGGRELMRRVEPLQHKVRVIHMGVSLPADPLRQWVRPRGPLRVLLGARFDEVKGHRYALQAVSRLKAAGIEVSIDFAGQGALKRTLEQYARELNVGDRVAFRGCLDHEELLARLHDHQWDVALLPSIDTGKEREGIPVFLIEAMAAGVPVVSTRTGGIPELLDGGAGILIPERDPTAIADALAGLAVDCNLRRQLASAGVRRVRDRFSIEGTVSALLEEILADPSGCVNEGTTS